MLVESSWVQGLTDTLGFCQCLPPKTDCTRAVVIHSAPLSEIFSFDQAGASMVEEKGAPASSGYKSVLLEGTTPCSRSSPPLTNQWQTAGCERGLPLSNKGYGPPMFI